MCAVSKSAPARLQPPGAVLDALDHAPAHTADIPELSGLPAGTVHRVLTQLVDAGEAMRTGAGKHGDPYLYARTQR
jgi:hypothetical protein